MEETVLELASLHSIIEIVLGCRAKWQVQKYTVPRNFFGDDFWTQQFAYNLVLCFSPDKRFLLVPRRKGPHTYI
jgi:hypothetical protein